MDRTTHDLAAPVCPSCMRLGSAPPQRTVAAMHTRSMLVTIALAVAGCGGVHGRAPVPVAAGTLAGVIRSADTGAGVTDVVVVVQGEGARTPVQDHTDAAGAYTIAGLAPGRYHVTIARDADTLGDEQVTILPGRLTGLDLVVGPWPAATDAMTPHPTVAGGAPLWRYRPTDADPRTGAVEGTVTETGQRTRLGGAVITVTDGDGRLIADAVSDDSGRYRCDDLPPGTYVVSAYYTLLGRGQFEIRRSDVTIAGGDVVVVPLAIETASDHDR